MFELTVTDAAMVLLLELLEEELLLELLLVELLLEELEPRNA
ncbi:MAG TPA: hypothetical protein VME21_08135 [Steroidobacteraceae bacterium]|nr:hypothetical protein [Steroidobacteraceae bacterium]